MIEVDVAGQQHHRAWQTMQIYFGSIGVINHYRGGLGVDSKNIVINTESSMVQAQRKEQCRSPQNRTLKRVRFQ